MPSIVPTCLLFTCALSTFQIQNYKWTTLVPVLICTISHNSLCLRRWSNWFPALPIGVVGLFFFFDRTSLVPARSEMAWRVKPSITRCDTLQPFLMEWWSYLVRIWSKLYYWEGLSQAQAACSTDLHVQQWLSDWDWEPSSPPSTCLLACFAYSGTTNGYKKNGFWVDMYTYMAKCLVQFALNAFAHGDFGYPSLH